MALRERGALLVRDLNLLRQHHRRTLDEPCPCFWKRHSVTLPLICWLTKHPDAVKSKSTQSLRASRVLLLPCTACACLSPLSFQAEHRTDTDS
jgi:hypothetical protein